jgi:Na+/H+ antiporter NhaD/arsenite permease-like protein
MILDIVVGFGFFLFIDRVIKWRKNGYPPVSEISSSEFRKAILHIVIVWVVLTLLAYFQWDDLQGNSIRLIALIGITILGSLAIIMDKLTDSVTEEV